MRSIVFVSGAVLMSLEMLGSRILAPYFGSSIFVWGSLISIFMAALAVGYSIGGSLADKKPQLQVLANVLAISGVLTVILPWIAEPVNDVLTNVDLGPRFGPLLASAVLFFLPSVFMGMVSPYAIKLQVKGLDTVGNTAGSLYAVSTLGSIAGTLGTSFFLITWLGTKLIIHLLGIVLLILAFAVAVMAVHQKRQSLQVVQTKVSRGHVDKKAPGQKGSGRGKKTLILLVLAALSGGMHTEAVSPSVSPDKIVYEKDSLYHRITVADEDGLRYLKFDASWQSAMYIDKPDKLVFPYTEFFHLGPLLNLQAKNALLVGLGGGSVPKNFLVNYPKLQFDVVEIDPEVITVAKRFFALKDDARLSLVARDGRTFFKQNKNRYDMIFLDAYYADAIPFHLATQEYMRELSGHLSSDGVVVSNVIGAVSGTRSRMFRSILKTYQSVFPHVYAFAVGKFQGNVSADKLQNIIVVSSMSAKPYDWKALVARAKSQVNEMKIPSDLTRILGSRITTSIPVNDVPVLTDDYAPVDSLLHF